MRWCELDGETEQFGVTTKPVPGLCNVEAEPAGSGGDSHCTAQTSGLPSAVTLKSSPRGTLLVKQHYYFRSPSGGNPRGLSILFPGQSRRN